MASEKVTIEQAVQKLSEANNNSNARLNALETKLDEIHLNVMEQNKNMNMNVPNEIIMNVQEKMINQIETIQKRAKELQDTTTSKLEEKQQQWDRLTDNIRDMRTEMKKNCEALERKASQKKDQNQLMEENVSTPHTQLNSSTINESFDNGQSEHHNITERRHHADIITQQTAPMRYTPQTTHTIVIPPPAAIPTFNGSISENPRQFLIRVKEYSETINPWNEQALLNAISQFLREIALEWYCQLRTSNRRPQT
ncbi:unnamed protein product [Rotaria socialis]|uniref:Uncharacterized protein n=1 Tax=Rotaria socialis TaxID=392032 RepID=A0A820XPM1_9BILA|nr:unnamed protein product [Rotaria socialis]CAF3762192.1 unnamed protein product [Rotaria socialis]CAF4536498.1 unnamed protein product [Rotaria socialis]CAF4639132.1 unnamed protein product [Rotaria socialis]